MTETDHPSTEGGADGQPSIAEGRSLEFEIEVAGSPEEVWAAIATGPGVSSWYVPHTIEERPEGEASARFGPGDDMVVPGRVAIWEPPERAVFDGGEGVDGLAFEWTVVARSGGTCTVRLVNSGFGTGDEWDAMYDGMAEGWPMFLLNLQLHRIHFPGQHGSAMLPTATWAGPPERAWHALTAALGLEGPVVSGDRVTTAGTDAPTFAGTVVDVADTRLAIILDEPGPGTAFLAAEWGHSPDTIEVSVWSYLYGPNRDDLVARDQDRWSAWLAARA